MARAVQMAPPPRFARTAVCGLAAREAVATSEIEDFAGGDAHEGLRPLRVPRDETAVDARHKVTARSLASSIKNQRVRVCQIRLSV